jgi:uncharacterized protein involved in copper resistance
MARALPKTIHKTNECVATACYNQGMQDLEHQYPLRPTPNIIHRVKQQLKNTPSNGRDEQEETSSPKPPHNHVTADHDIPTHLHHTDRIFPSALYVLHYLPSPSAST